MLKSLGIEFLLDPEDSVVHYMEIGIQRVAELHARRDNLISEALAELPHPAAVEVARGRNLHSLSSPISRFSIGFF